MPAEVQVDVEGGRRRATGKAKVLAASPVLPEHKIAGKTPAARGCPPNCDPLRLNELRGPLPSAIPSRKPLYTYIYI